MNTYSKRRSITWLCVVLAGLCLACFLVWRAQNIPSHKGPVALRIGAAIALTGFAADFGESERNAIALLKEKYPRVEFIIEDNKSEPGAGLSAINKLINVDRVDIIYCDLTTVASAGMEITKDNRRIMMATVYLNDLMERSPYSIRNLPRGSDESRLVLNDLKKRAPLALSALAAIGSPDDFGHSSVSDFEKVARELSANVVIADYMPAEPAAFKSFVAKILAKQPKAIYLASLAPSLGTLVSEIRSAGFDGVIMSTDAFAYDYIRSAAGAYAKGVVYPDFPHTAQYDALAQRYEHRFSKKLIPSAVLCLDGLSLLIDKWPAEGSLPNPEAFLSSLDGISFEGTFGTTVMKGREIVYPLELKVAGE